MKKISRRIVRRKRENLKERVHGLLETCGIVHIMPLALQALKIERSCIIFWSTGLYMCNVLFRNRDLDNHSTKGDEPAPKLIILSLQYFVNWFSALAPLDPWINPCPGCCLEQHSNLALGHGCELRFPAPLSCGERKGQPEQCGRKWLHAHEYRFVSMSYCFAHFFSYVFRIDVHNFAFI